MRSLFAGLLAAAAVLLLPNPSHAGGWGYLYGAVKLTTDYRFHGFSESNRRPTVQANLHWVAPDNWYVGIFASHVNFLDGSTDYEIDWYGGRHVLFDDNDLNLEILYYTFPDKAGPSPTYNAIQGSAELTRAFGKLKLSPKVLLKHSHNGIGTMAELTAALPVTAWLTLGGNTGYQAGAQSASRMHWDAGLTARAGEFLFDVHYTGTNAPKSRCYFTDWCATGLTATVTYQFGWSL